MIKNKQSIQNLKERGTLKTIKAKNKKDIGLLVIITVIIISLLLIFSMLASFNFMILIAFLL